jgi:hypothetical protein
MTLRSRAAILRLDPLLDREEYNVLLHLEEDVTPDQAGRLDQVLGASDDPARRQLWQRIENLGVLDWQLWAWGKESSEDVIDARPRTTVLDLGGSRRCRNRALRHWPCSITCGRRARNAGRCSSSSTKPTTSALPTR